MKANDILKFILSYPERIVFLVCFVAFLIVLLVFYFGNHENGNLKIIEQRILSLKKTIDSNEPLTQKPIEYLKEIKNNWEVITATTLGNPWLMYRKPIFVPGFTDNVPPPDRYNLPPENLKLQNIEDPDKVIVAWNKNKDSSATIDGYNLYRQDKEGGVFKLVAELPIVGLTITDSGYFYIDSGLSPESLYSYYVTAFSNDKNVDKKISDASKQFKVTTSKDYKIDFYQVESEKVWTKITKYINGQWPTEMYNISIGEKIGRGQFFTGCTLIQIKDYLYMHPTLKYEIKTKEIIYVDRKSVQYNYIIIPK